MLSSGTPAPRSARPGVGLLAAAAMLSALPVQAGLFDVVPFETGPAGSGPLTSVERPAPLEGAGTEFHFQIAYETEATPGPNTLFDSITVSLLGPGGSPVATVATLDAFGLTPLPQTDGGLFINPARFTQAPADRLFPAVLPNRSAFDVVLSLPPELSGVALTVAMDFFDNGDSFASRAYVALPSTAAVPEPGRALLLLLGLGGLFWCRRR